MNVVDISAWQSDDDGHTKVDWDGLVTAGVEGVIIKIGEHSTLDGRRLTGSSTASIIMLMLAMRPRRSARLRRLTHG